MNKPKFEVAVGFFVVVGFLILSIIVFFVSGVYFFRPGYHLGATFDYVGIINRGAPVRFLGVRVGEVSEVKILHPTAQNPKAKVEITFFLEKHVEIRERYQISIQGTHIMSEPHIAITPVPEGGRILKDGDVIPNGISPATVDELLKRSESITKRFDSLLGSISEATENPETRQMLFNSLKNMNQLLASMNAMTAGQEKEMRSMILNLNKTTDQMSQLLERINKGEGTLGKLAVDDELYNDIRDFTSDIKKHPWKLFKKG